MRVALVHYWLLGMRGGEKVLEALCQMYPEADIFTLFYDAGKVSPLIHSRRVTASFLNPLRRYYRSLLPLMPLALEHLDLRGYDLVISSESGPAKGVLVSAGARHICYCHSPMRYLWELYPDYVHDWTPRWKRPFMAPLASYLRMWDYAAAARVDTFVGNSDNTRKRIWRAYRRPAAVVYPPVSTSGFYCKQPEDYFLIVSEFVRYKQLDYAVAVFTKLGLRLKLVGDGPEYQSLRSIAGPTVEFCGRVSDAELRELYACCRAFLVPGEEDFGIAAVEALASGKPLVALARGGSVEIMGNGPRIGIMYPEPTMASLEAAVRQMNRLEATFVPSHAQTRAGDFSAELFPQRFRAAIASAERDDRDAPAVH